MIEVLLKKPHKQGEVQYYAGQTVLLDIETANWLTSTELQARLEVAQKASEIPGTPEYEEARRADK